MGQILVACREPRHRVRRRHRRHLVGAGALNVVYAGIVAGLVLQADDTTGGRASEVGTGPVHRPLGARPRRQPPLAHLIELAARGHLL
ncbi:MAG: hypothetical protein M0Z82_06000, partial [Actinomycetota bacterium]|nr:hypothetical protein [Actinomycetota bacterium]